MEMLVRGRRRGSTKLSLLLLLSYGSLIAVFQGIQNILVPAAVQRLAPDGKVGVLALLTTLSAVLTVVALLTGGMLSDRTRTRFGRRTPWLVGTAAAAVAVMAAMARADSIGALVVLMPLLWFFTNFYQAVITAILPERVPVADRGFAAAAMALGVPLGIFVGVNVAAAAPSPLLGYAVLAGLFGAATAALVLLDREPSSRGMAAPPPPSAPRDFLGAFADRDFALTFASRFLLFLSLFTVTGYLFYILQDYIGLDRLPGRSPGRAVSLIVTLKTAVWFVMAPVTGLLSDRIGRTVAIVAATGVATGVVMLVPVLAGSWPGMVLWGGGIGLTFGVYFALDLKLASLVLPSAAAAGRDMGVIGIASSAPNILAPALAAAVINAAGFPALFLCGSVLAVLGGLVALPVRIRVREAAGVPA